MEPTDEGLDHRTKNINRILWLFGPSFFVLCVVLAGFISISKPAPPPIEDFEEISSAEDNSFIETEYDNQSSAYSTQSVDTVIDFNSDEEAAEKKKVYLTFDDGPSIYTNTILDTLAEYDVKATFFVVGHKESFADAAYKRIVDEGHTLAMHSFSHRYSELYQSMDSFTEDTEKLQEFLYERTGVWCRYYRFPGGSSNTVSKVPIPQLIDYLENKGIKYFDWNIQSGDAVRVSLPESEIVENCVKDLNNFNTCIILMHDTGDRKSTVDALDDVIKTILERGDCVILPITDDTVPIRHRIEQN